MLAASGFMLNLCDSSPMLGSMNGTLRRRIGARLLAERVQVKNWNELEAARAGKIEPKTVRRIERGQNYEMESLEKYAAALGHPLEWWLIDILSEEIQRGGGSPSSSAGGPFR
jgi:hypothetical protein